MMLARLITLIRNTRAATAIEYGLIVALIVIAIVAAISTVGGSTGSMWGTMTGKIGNALPVS
jgi:pilus assembly protein Flp/PilA